MPLAVIFVDQITKWTVRQGTTTIIGPFKLETVINSSGAFSLPLPAMLLTVVWLAILGYLTAQVGQRGAKQALLAVIGGGVSNVLDRLIIGGVQDIAALGNLFFNVADVVIVTGAVSAVVILIAVEVTRVHDSTTIIR